MVGEVFVCAVLEFGRAVEGLEEEAECHRFETCEEGRHAVVDVVVGQQAGRREELAVEHGEDDLVYIVSLGTVMVYKMLTMTYALDDLEEDYAEEGIYFCTLSVCTTHLGLHSFGKSTCGFEGTCNNQDAGDEKPQVGM